MTSIVSPGTEKNPYYADCFEEITALIKALVPIIWVVTHEESRFVKEFQSSIATPLKRKVWLWSGYQGLSETKTGSSAEQGTATPNKALERICSITTDRNICSGHVFIMRDFHEVFANSIPRQLRDMYDHLIETNKCLIITAPVLAHGPMGSKSGLPPTLEKQITVVQYELPKSAQISSKIRNIVQDMQGKSQGKAKTATRKLDYTDTEFKDFTKALQGLTMLEVDNSVATSFTHMKKLDVEKLINDKKQILRKSQILEFIDTPVGMDEVGGLDMAKEYLGKYSKAYSDEAKEFGVEPLKGLLLTGVPGTGKSLLAKAIGRLWKVPLLRFDVGKVMTGLVGGSEQKMREVIDQAVACAPCVLWIDEVEKSLSGTKSSNFSDGGTLARVFGTLLTAMQDGLKDITIVATANDISMLPPEFIRRFNEVFFVDLPGPDERWEIFNIHLKKRGRDVTKFETDKAKLLEASDNYTGAEIEKAIKDALAAAFYSEHKDVTSQDILAALADTKPIFKVMRKKVEALRAAAKGQYRYASSYSKESSAKVKTSSGKTLDLDSAIADMGEFVKKPKKNKDELDRFSDAISDETEEEAENE